MLMLPNLHIKSGHNGGGEEGTKGEGKGRICARGRIDAREGGGSGNAEVGRGKVWQVDSARGSLYKGRGKFLKYIYSLIIRFIL